MKFTNKFTRGDWRVFIEKSERRSVESIQFAVRAIGRRGSTWRALARTPFRVGDDFQREDEINAYLMAAAPTLLIACQTVYSEIEEATSVDQEQLQRWSDLLASAIARAEAPESNELSESEEERMLAVAPDLLKACELALTYGKFPARAQKVKIALRAAIAKAKGSAQ